MMALIRWLFLWRGRRWLLRRGGQAVAGLAGRYVQRRAGRPSAGRWLLRALLRRVRR